MAAQRNQASPYSAIKSAQLRDQAPPMETFHTARSKVLSCVIKRLKRRLSIQRDQKCSARDQVLSCVIKRLQWRLSIQRDKKCSAARLSASNGDFPYSTIKSAQLRDQAPPMETLHTARSKVLSCVIKCLESRHQCDKTREAVRALFLKSPGLLAPVALACGASAP
eukprot:1143305-Pelagomonas_calceolata.AAC.4